MWTRGQHRLRLPLAPANAGRAIPVGLNAMKPLMILAPSTSRWSAIEQLLAHEDAALLRDLRARLTKPADGHPDAFAIAPDGSKALACAAIRRSGNIGVLGPVFTRPEFRRRGLARGLLQTLLSWFDMTGGKWLYATSPREICAEMFEHFGFSVLRRYAGDGEDLVTMLRRQGRTPESPFEKLDPRMSVRAARRSDWPLLVALLQHFPGADPRTELDESAAGAERAALEWLAQAEDGACKLTISASGGHVVGLGSLATGQTGRRSYAMLVPHNHPPEGLRNAVLSQAAALGYEQVDFPMEALRTPERATPDEA